MALVVTPGANNADSYIDADPARDFLASMPWHAAFVALHNSDIAKFEAYLRQGAQLLQSRPYRGTRVSATQALDWPRVDALDPDFTDRYYAEDEIPLRLQHAQATWASHLYKLGADPSVPLTTEAFDEIQVGPIRVRSKGSGGATRSFSKVPKVSEFIAERLAPPPHVLRYLKPLFRSAVSQGYFERIS